MSCLPFWAFLSQFIIDDVYAVFSKDDIDVGLRLRKDFYDWNIVVAVVFYLYRMSVTFEAKWIIFHNVPPKDVYDRKETKADRIRRLSDLPEADDIIFNEIAIERYGSVEDMKNAFNKLPEKRKRGRPKKASWL